MGGDWPRRSAATSLCSRAGSAPVLAAADLSPVPQSRIHQQGQLEEGTDHHQLLRAARRKPDGTQSHEGLSRVVPLHELPDEPRSGPRTRCARDTPDSQAPTTMRIARPDAMPPQPARSGLLTNILRGWNKFWFTPASPLPLGLIRICTGFVILYIHAIYSLDLLALVGPEGWIDHKTITEFRTGTQFYPIPGGWPSDGSPDDMFSTTPSQGLPSWSVYFHITDTTAIVACHIGFLIAMAMFTVGFATRVTSVLAWVGVISYIQRTPTTVFGMDTMMNILMVYLMIGPSGATLSVDRWIQKWRARKEGREPDPVQPSVMANFAIRLMQVR